VADEVGVAEAGAAEVGTVVAGAALDDSPDPPGSAPGESSSPSQPATMSTAARSAIDKCLMTATTIWLG
jgi:hypothetical protein